MPGRPCVVCRKPAELGRVCKRCRASSASSYKKASDAKKPKKGKPQNIGRQAAIKEPVSPKPFLAWLDSLNIEHVGVRLSAVWGIGEASCDRRLYRWREETDVAERELIEQAIDALDPDTLYVDLYGEDVQRTKTGRKKPSNAGVPMVVPEDVLIEAHRLHVDEGVSIRELGRRYFDQCWSASPRALANCIHNAFRQRGWETRSRSEATALANRHKHDDMPTCAHVHAAGPKAGQRCDRKTSTGWCWHHRPERIAEGVARLRSREPARNAHSVGSGRL